MVELSPSSTAFSEAMVKSPIIEPLSVTHTHLLSCLQTVLAAAGSHSVTRILDVGCGDGLLVKYLTQSLAQILPGQKIEIFGLDVNDHGVQAPDYWEKTQRLLAKELPSVDWSQRLKLVSVTDPWPFPDAWFHAVVSNQVLEHVQDHAFFFREHRRVLAPQGTGIHLFPLHHCILEPHLLLPLVHWVKDFERRKSAIAVATRLGFGRFSGTKAERDKYAAGHAAYLVQQVNYKTQDAVANVALAAGLVPTFAQTHFYYAQKIRSLLGQPRIATYRQPPNLLGNLYARLLRYVSSVTLHVRPASEPDGNGRSNRMQVDQ